MRIELSGFFQAHSALWAEHHFACGVARMTTTTLGDVTCKSSPARR
jgi:hypothetical protein